MASAVPLWLLGKEVTIQMTPLTIDTTTGVVGSTTPVVNFFGILDAGNPLGVQNSVQKVEISNADNPYDNKVIVQQGSSMTISEVLQASAGSSTVDTNTGLWKNAIEKMVATSFHYQVVVVYKDPAGTTKRTNTGKWQYNGHGETYTKGKANMSLALETFTTITGGAYDVNPVLS